MKKRWLSLCGIYFLGLATIPGLMLAEQWLRQSQASRPKFTDTGYKTENATASSFALLDDTDPLQELVVAKNSESASTNSDKKAVGSSATEPFRLTPSEADRKLRRDTVQSNSPATAQAPHKTKPAPARNSDFEEFAVADQKPLQREIQTEEEFDSPFREPVSIVAPRRSSPSASKPSTDVSDGIESLAETNPSDEQKAKLTTLREKLAELMKAKAELINEQTLSQEVSALEKQISDLHAAQKLLSAQQILRLLAEEFPDSPAAVRAKRMLEAADSTKSHAPRSELNQRSALPTYR